MGGQAKWVGALERMGGQENNVTDLEALSVAVALIGIPVAIKANSLGRLFLFSTTATMQIMGAGAGAGAGACAGAGTGAGAGAGSTENEASRNSVADASQSDTLS